MHFIANPVLPRQSAPSALPLRILCLGFFSLAAIQLDIQSAWAADAATVHFGSDVRPLLNEHCVACHGGVKQAAGLSFIHRDAALDVIEPGAPADSVMVERLKSTDEFEVMPPPEHGRALTKQEIAILENWISQGADWEQPWSYEKPVAPAAPKVSDPAWCRQPLDRWVLQRLDETGITPAKQASPAQWLRRVSLDLTGLPPTVREHDQFLVAADRDGEAAYEHKVRELLSRPSFGERWASVWLDQIRYADSRGLGSDAKRDIWKYRDWVISAFNQDMPFDEFTIKQLAGDLLPTPSLDDLVATAANRLTQANDEGGTDDEEFRIAAVLDRVSTVWQTWQGLTIGCVQCHSHPYDPISHDEFYQSVAFFNNTADCDLGEEYPKLDVPLDSSQNSQAKLLDAKIRALRESIWNRESQLLTSELVDWTPIKTMEAETNKPTQIEIQQRDGVTEFVCPDTLSSNTDITLTAEIPDGVTSIGAMRVTIAPRDPQTAISDSEWGFVLSHVKASLILPSRDSSSEESDASTEASQQKPIAVEFSYVVGDEPHPFRNPSESLDEKSKEGFAAYSRIHFPRTAVFALKEPVSVPAGAKLIVELTHRVSQLGAFPLISRRGSLALTSSPTPGQHLAQDDLATDRKALVDFISKRGEIKSMSMPIMRERPDHLRRPTHVFIRGLFLTKGDLVTAGVPESLPPIETAQNDGNPPTRLDFARWLVSKDNPLTARVTANRIWARLMGVGLVATEEDFGSSGESPSHPELLDHLATKFQFQEEWSQKELIRSIVLSSTYRQDAMTRPELRKQDPQNRLLASGPRFRMPAEMVRDCALMASGLLSEKMNGVPVRPPLPPGVWKPFSGEKWNTPSMNDPDRYRRSLYTFMKRSIPYPMFSTFDAPSREFCSPRRLRSNTPLQALMMLNDTTFVECTEALAKRMGSMDTDLKEQIRFGFVSVASRNLRAAEIKSLQELYQQCRADEGSQKEAMEAVASVLLNLDEIMSK